MVFAEMDAHGHEQVTYLMDDATGLRSIVAIHDTTLGPSLGGTRLLPYETEAAALADVLRLSGAMTYKAAAADLELGGGKAVIIADPDDKTPALLRAYGRGVDWLGGRYITSVDINTGVEDMEHVAAATEHVVGREDGLGDPSPVTATGVHRGMRACAEAVYGDPDLGDRRVVIQGVGKVGRDLARRLADDGAEVVVSDIDEAKVEAFADEHGFDVVAPDGVYDEPADIFAPCAVGGVIDDDTVDRLAVDIVAGGANNVLAERRHAEALAAREVLYAPDYVINAGGLITVATEAVGGTKAEAIEAAERIGDRLLGMIEDAADRGTTVLEAADRYAEARIEAAR
ncbi:MAG: Leu/Phe/Val dehydrogenase [Halobacteriales archaeon]